MHWLPLVAMVIASALPFPHNPVSRIAAAFEIRREDRHDPAARLTASTPNYSFHMRASRTHYDTAAALGPRADRRNLRDSKDYVRSDARQEKPTFKVENPGSYHSNSDSGSERGVPSEAGTSRTEDVFKDSDAPKGNRADSRQDSGFVNFSWTDSPQNSTERALQVSTAGTHVAVSPAASLNGQRGPEPTVPTVQLRDKPTVRTGGEQPLGTEGGPTDDSLAPEEGLDLRSGPDDVLEGGEMFLDAHPRVLFSSSPSPPEHPPLLLMLESGMLEDDGDREEQEDVDGHIEGHGDRAIERSTARSSTAFPSGVARPPRREKRSPSIDRRRGERSVCETESVWVNDKKTAFDSHGKQVTILQEIQTQTGPLKQYFYETRCRQDDRQNNASRSRSSGAAARPQGTGIAGAGCLGVDKKQWLSECKVKQSFVRALAKDAENKIGWRWIRIDSSCVCVLLSRANQPGRQFLTRNGRG